MIRFATNDDAPELAEILRRDAEEQGWPEPVDVDAVRDVIASTLCVVAEDGSGRMVGATAARVVPMYFSRDGQFLASLFITVLPDARGEGHGRDMLAFLEHEADARGVILTAQAQPGDTKASQIYAKRGYKQVDATWARY